MDYFNAPMFICNRRSINSYADTMMMMIMGRMSLKWPVFVSSGAKILCLLTHSLRQKSWGWKLR